MSVLPPWLQIVVAVAAIVGTILAGITLWLRWRDTRPRLLIETSKWPEEGRTKQVQFKITNTGRAPVTIEGQHLELAFPGHPARSVNVGLTGNRRNLPFRLEHDDNEVLFAPYSEFH